jgi:hypothetical protein
MIAIDRLEQQIESSNKVFKSKIMSGAKERATKQYFKDTAARARRKQGKTRFDTFRRDEQPDAEDLRLEDIHFANFLGLKSSVYGVPYNQNYIDEPINLNECDTLRPELEADNISAISVISENFSDNDSIYDNLIDNEDDSEDELDRRQIERETNVNWHLNWTYDPSNGTLTGDNGFKRRHDDDDDESEVKRLRSDSDEILRMEEGLLKQEEDNFTAMVAYMQEQDNFAAMVDYMRQQVELAKKLMNDALYGCDCNN